MLAGESLHPSNKGKRIHCAGTKRTIVDGPFAESKELIAGYWLWQVKSMDEAVEWARRCPDPMPGEEGVLEIRPAFEVEEFGDNATQEIRDRVHRHESELTKREQS